MEDVTQARVRDALDRVGLHYLQDESRAVVPFSERAEHPAFHAGLIVSGDKVLNVYAEVHIAVGHIPLDCLLRFCNAWNETHRWPTAAVGINTDGSHRLKVVSSTPFPSGASDSQLISTVSLMVGTACEFAENSSVLVTSGDWSLSDEELRTLADGGGSRGSAGDGGGWGS